ncbi:MAG: hypothetical protein M1503_12335 [Thaumarchaeota archaeon]|nr:hypothetical protein [Nitrososphaerota archaeon]MCL5319028.1 hypothetical protein [Nitrososphaerota archaeon]
MDIQASLKEVSFEDWGEGIKDVESFRTYGQYSKAKLGGEIIGMKGLGKLSLLRLGKNVNYRTNNGEYGIDIIMTPTELDAEMGGKDKFLQHRGTKVIIPNPEEVPPIDELSDYLKKAFGLRIASGIEIILNDVKLTSRVDKTERFLFRLKGDIDVTGNLKGERKGRGSVDIYVRHVLVQSLIVDPERCFGGWVNCNGLIPSTDRNELVKERIYNDFLAHLKQYVIRFPKREEDVSLEEMLIGSELSRLLKSYLKFMNLFPEGRISLGRGKEQSNSALSTRSPRQKGVKRKEPEEELPDYVKVHTSIKTDKPIRRTSKTDYGIMWLDQDYGNEKEPLFFIEPNMVVRNRTNDLYKFALKSKQSLGPKWLRLLPYLSRVAASVNPDSKKWTHEQMNLEIDRATRYFLKYRKEL